MGAVALKLPCPPDLCQSLSKSPMSSSSDLSSRAKLNYDSDKFTVEFNVAEYSPEDLHIKTEGDVLIVSAKQESKTSTGKSFVFVLQMLYYLCHPKKKFMD